MKKMYVQVGDRSTFRFRYHTVSKRLLSAIGRIFMIISVVMIEIQN